MGIGKISGGVLALALAATSYAVPSYAEGTRADDALGVWVRTKKDWLVEFKMCEDNPELLCGEVVAGEGVDKGTGESVVGVQMLYNLARHARKDDRWVGTMYNPGDGNEYAGSVTVLRDGRIKMSGCMMKIMCRSEKWPRASEEAVAALYPAEEAAPDEGMDMSMDEAGGEMMEHGEDHMDHAEDMMSDMADDATDAAEDMAEEAEEAVTDN